MCRLAKDTLKQKRQPLSPIRQVQQQVPASAKKRKISHFFRRHKSSVIDENSEAVEEDGDESAGDCTGTLLQQRSCSQSIMDK